MEGFIEDLRCSARSIRHVVEALLAGLVLCACGYGEDGAAVESREPQQLSLLIGDTAGPGNTDGPAAVARLGAVGEMVIDDHGNLLVMDLDNRSTRSITPAGDVSTTANAGGVFGVRDLLGNQYAVDEGNNTVRKVLPTGEISIYAGTPGVAGFIDGPAAQARFRGPQALAIDKATGTLFVLDASNQAIRRITSDGQVSTLAGTGQRGNQDGPGSSASFRFCDVIPWDWFVWSCPAKAMAIDRDGNVFVPDYYNGSIRRIAADGTVSTVALLAQVRSVVVSDAGIIYAATGDDGVIATTRSAIIYRISPGGQAQYFAGQALVLGSATPMFPNSAGCSLSLGAFDVDASALVTVGPVQPGTPTEVCRIGPGGPVALTLSGMGDQALWPGDVAVGPDGSYFVPDVQRHVVRRIRPDGSVETFAGVDQRQGQDDGPAAQATFTGPRRIAADRHGNLFVTDSFNAIRKITATGVVSTLAGTAGIEGTADGPASSATFNRPGGLAVDVDGNVYVADTRNHTVRKISSQGIVSTLAGSAGQPGSEDGVGADARFNSPLDVAVDTSGNVYVADRGHTIRKVSSSGVVSTVVGTPGRSGFIEGALPGVISAPRHLVMHGSTLFFMTYGGIARVTGMQ